MKLSYYQRNRDIILEKQKQSRKVFSPEKRQKLLDYQRAYYKKHFKRINEQKKKPKPFFMKKENGNFILNFD